MDVVYASAELLARQHPESTIIDGVPTLAVEILSPSNTIEDLNEKIDALLNAGTPLVWIVDPHWRTVTIHQPGKDTSLLTASQDLTGEPHLPGFRVAVKRLFE